MKKYMVLKSKKFSMRRVFLIVFEDDKFCYGKVLSPKCWGLESKPMTLTKEQTEKEYISASKYFNKDNYTE